MTPAHIAAIFGWFAILLAGAGIIYQLIASVVTRQFFATAALVGHSTEAVTLLKPLYGAEPRLFDNLATFLEQQHDGPVQMVCGVQRDDDPAIAVVRALQSAYPAATIDLVIDATRHGANGKVSNLINMMPAARHPIIVLSDSDMAAAPDYLARVLAALDRPGIGVVSCLYRGRGDGNFWSRLGAAGLTYQFIIGVVVAVAYKLAAPCMGSTIALRRETLDRIGGFKCFADTLADDHAIGQAVIASGLNIAVPPMFVTHAFDETGIGELWRHEVRWAATVRDIAFWPYVGVIIGLPLPVACLAVLYTPTIGLWLVAASLVARFIVVRSVDAAAGGRPAAFRLAILHDYFAFAVYIASFFVQSVDWRGATLTMKAGGRISSPRSAES
ncbi:bacteriohopanetetrol glucosamine biosynthesis glycosyltransferase HpnI [Sphingomonas sp. GB1N7]|uniref:bacteriohopanetetrol glucosamine biosynthesis glycosyltransferase HpnI n=1 Tax=Parasphingomonas caseinilytica TaxID=3096158 RepID=UPI002FCC2647